MILRQGGKAERRKERRKGCGYAYGKISEEHRKLGRETTPDTLIVDSGDEWNAIND